MRNSYLSSQNTYIFLTLLCHFTVKPGNVLQCCFVLGANEAFCYQRIVNNYCVDQSPTNMTKYDCCCSERTPAGWGPLCDKCPGNGTGIVKTINSFLRILGPWDFLLNRPRCLALFEMVSTAIPTGQITTK